MASKMTVEIESTKQELLRRARAIVGEFQLSEEGLSAGGVGAALITKGGNIYTGICLDFYCGIGFCAEHAAVAEMLKARETEIKMIVAVTDDAILPPCGRCRELMAQVNRNNFDTLVVLPGERVATLRELLPEHWIIAGGQ